MTNEEALEVLTPFYDLFRHDKRNWEKGFEVLDDHWKSYYTNDKFRTKEETRPYIQGLFEIVPNIQVEILNLQMAANTAVVRTRLSGTPATDFMVPHTGRSFSIMTIDLHTIENGKITELYHLEDWGTAINQLSGKKDES